MPATYEPIASVTLSSASSTEFTGISGSFTDLVLVVAGVCSANVVGFMQVGNGSLDTGSNYSTTALLGDGSTAQSYRWSSQTFMRADASGTGTGQFIWTCQLMSYANTNVNKTVLSAYAGAGQAVGRNVNLWRSTSAITNVRFYLSSGTITGTASLFGIKAA